MKDYIVRATAANNQIRAFVAATTRDVVETVQDRPTIQARWQRRHSDDC